MIVKLVDFAHCPRVLELRRRLFLHACWGNNQTVGVCGVKKEDIPRMFLATNYKSLARMVCTTVASSPERSLASARIEEGELQMISREVRDSALLCSVRSNSRNNEVLEVNIQREKCELEALFYTEKILFSKLGYLVK